MVGVPCLTLRDVQGGRPELHLLPPQIHQLRDPQAVPVGHKDHRSVPMPPTVLSGRVHQPLDLGLGKILAGSQVGVGSPSGPPLSLALAAWVSETKEKKRRISVAYLAPGWRFRFRAE